MLTVLEHLLWASLPLALLVLLARPLARRLAADGAWCFRWDLSLALCGGVLFAVLGTFHLADGHLQHLVPVTGADFHDYCGCIGASRGDHDGGWRANRSFAAGVLPSVLARRYGVIDGLLLGAILSQVMLGAGLYIWARALHSRVAGVAAVLIACAVAPLVVLGRTLTFYPEIVGVSVLASALCVLALRTGKLWAVLASGVGIGLVLLMDVRGLVWAPAMLVTVAIAVLTQGTWRRRGLGVGLLALPLILSNTLGDRAFLPGVPGLERQVESYVRDAFTTLGEVPRPPSTRTGEEAIWGRTSAGRIPGSLYRSMQATSGLSDQFGDHPENVAGRTLQVVPWVGITAAALMIAIWGLRRRWALTLGLIVPLLPFLGATHSASWVLYRDRYLAAGMAVVPVLIGVALGVLIHGALKRADLKTHVRPSLALPAVAVVLLTLVLGVVPSWLGPEAHWRQPMSPDRNPQDALRSALSGSQEGPRAGRRCVESLQADFAAGIPAGSQLLDWRLERPEE